MEEELISIIVPIYKVENYLERCLNSILKQTYINLEIILIDDGSTDSSGSICDNYSKKDKRIVTIHNENQGVSASRNNGLNIANGKYITFIDSDDFVSENYIEELYKMITLNNADMAIIGNDEQYNDGIIKMNKKLKVTINAEKTIKKILEEKYISSVCWGKMYKKTLLDDIKFDTNINIGEDFKFIIEVLDKANKISIDTKQNLYHYKMTENSVTKQKNRKNDWLEEIKLTESMFKPIEEKYPKIKSRAIQRYIRVNITFLTNMIKENDEELKNEIEQFYKRVSQYKFTYIFRTKANIKYKIKFILLLTFPNILIKLYHLRVTNKI